ncbi:MAG TPA: Crp/Fnr family transcriptional regulator [Candidatus Dormibacteraeota bacterium]|nr:Crp/Fnr family transcriptional regulator [Candidatus Dormibacteraeota bacterium]
MDDLAVIRASRMFAGVPTAELQPLLRAARRFDIRPGQPLWLQGDPVDGVYVIGEGHIKSYRVGVDGQQFALWLFGPGDTTGEPGLFLPAGFRGTSNEAVERTFGIVISGPAFLDFIDHHPLVNRRVLQRLSEMLRDSLTMPSEMAYLDIPGRVARKLLELAAIHGKPSSGATRIGIRISQGTLAEMVAASRENVNRSLAPLLSGGIVSHEGGYFTILDMERLRTHARVEPGLD